MTRAALHFSLSILVVIACGAAACGGRTPPSDIGEPVFEDDAGAREELCNGLDDDGDGRVDETFRDEAGRYVQDEHCGSCEQRCDAPIDRATDVACMLLGDSAGCAAVACDEGFELTNGGRCAATDDYVCLPCLSDADCGPTASARCAELGGEQRCTHGCASGCPEGYACPEDGADLCVPIAGSCRCPLDTAEPFSFACEVAPGCIGRAECRAGSVTSCEAEAERCGGGDEDCDGTLDEGFVDERGAYSLDLHHCGACGHDCTLDEGTALPLTCGGDPFAPSCVIACPDAADGIQVGDLLDADRDIDNGCECRVSSLADAIGSPSGGGAIDENCDGADGSVLTSFYVATTGDDANPGSPTRPLATISEAVRRAAATLNDFEPRLDVFVAGGVYTEAIHLEDGVRVHGGYRTDYLARDTSGYEVIVVAPALSAVGDPPGGAALIARDAGFLPTLIEGIELRGRDAIDPGEAAIGAVVLTPGPQLTLRDMRIRAGRPAPGASGSDGVAGAASTQEAQNGRRPRAAVEDGTHFCFSSDANTTSGGNGGRNTCEGLDVSGGRGGTALCPIFSELAESGYAGNGRAGTPGGNGGGGGVDLVGPIEGGASCPSGVCCGLADFTVPGDTFLALPGSPGTDGPEGAAGQACSDAAGTFDFNGVWVSTGAAFGTSGQAGAGGGGGGAGGGAVINWFDGLCEFADGIGGSGGGGGAGGCGGNGGGPGQSGGPSVAVVVRVGLSNQLPVIENSVLHTQDGGDGGDGGNGGDGGPGGSGGYGGRVPDEERITPSLAGPSGGERGGKGGAGGPGGGGGGGCGGSSVGVWIAGVGGALDPSPFSGANTFELGAGGGSGHGGGGPIPAANGAAGQRLAVLIQ